MTAMDCKQALERLYEYLDGELTPETTEEVRRHIEICAACYPEVKTTTEFRDLLDRVAECQPHCPDSLRQRIGELLKEETGRA